MMMVGVKFAYFLAVLTLVSFQFERFDATLIDRLNELMAGQEKLQEEVEDISVTNLLVYKNFSTQLQTGEKELKAGQQELKAELKTDKEELEEKVEEISDAVNFLARANLTGLNGVGEKLNDVKEKIDEVLFQITESEGNGTGGHGTAPVEIKVHGTAGASTYYDSRYPPSNAFKKDSSYWHSTSGLPQLIWMHYQKPHRLQQIGITSQRNLYAPKSFEVIGSMDCVHWTTIFDVANAGFPNDSSAQRRYWIIPLERRRLFSCIGLRVNTIWNMGGPYVLIEQIDLWE